MIHTVSAAILLLAMFLQTPVTSAQSRTSQPQRGQRAATAKAQPPMTLRQVIESLVTLKNSKRVEDLISKSGVDFQATPAVLQILKDMGASAKLLSMIPATPPPPSAPSPALAGPLTVTCEPKDCLVAVDEMYKGPTSQNRMTITGLRPGESTVEVFADGYERLTRRVRLEQGKPADEKFSLKRSAALLRQSASASLLKAVATLGGTDGFGELADIEGSGTMRWTNSAGNIEEWTMTFNKRIGKDLSTTFKTKEGQCTASIVGQAAKQECRGGLKNSGEKIAEQGSSLLLSYQLQDVIQALLKRPLIALQTDENRLQTADGKDSYVFAISNDGLPSGLVYTIGDGNAPIQVQYSDYLKMANGWYPGKISIGRVNSMPVWVFTFNTVRSKIAGARR